MLIVCLKWIAVHGTFCILCMFMLNGCRRAFCPGELAGSGTVASGLGDMRSNNKLLWQTSCLHFELSMSATRYLVDRLANPPGLLEGLGDRLKESVHASTGDSLQISFQFESLRFWLCIAMFIGNLRRRMIPTIYITLYEHWSPLRFCRLPSLRGDSLVAAPLNFTPQQQDPTTVPLLAGLCPGGSGEHGGRLLWHNSRSHLRHQGGCEDMPAENSAHCCPGGPSQAVRLVTLLGISIVWHRLVTGVWGVECVTVGDMWLCVECVTRDDSWLTLEYSHGNTTPARLFDQWVSMGYWLTSVKLHVCYMLYYSALASYQYLHINWPQLQFTCNFLDFLVCWSNYFRNKIKHNQMK